MWKNGKRWKEVDGEMGEVVKEKIDEQMEEDIK